LSPTLPPAPVESAPPTSEHLAGRAARAYRVGEAEAAADALAGLLRAVPDPPPQGLHEPLRELLAAVQRQDPLACADLLEDAFATALGWRAPMAERDALPIDPARLGASLRLRHEAGAGRRLPILERRGDDGQWRRAVSAVAPRREAKLQAQCIDAQRGADAILLLGVTEGPLLSALRRCPGPAIVAWDPLGVPGAAEGDDSGERDSHRDRAGNIHGNAGTAAGGDEIEGGDADPGGRATAAGRRLITMDPATPVDPAALRSLLLAAGIAGSRVACWIHPALAGSERARAFAWAACATALESKAAPRESSTRGRGVPAPTPCARTRQFSRLRVCLLTRGRPFHGERGLASALRALGHDVHEEAIGSAPEDARAAHEIARRAPDLIVCINGAALARGPISAELLRQRQLPTVLWFVDDPEPALRDPSRFVHSSVLALAWEREAVARLRRWGFAGAAYLPLAAAPRMLLPGTPRASRPPGQAAVPPLAMVGSSYAGPDRRRLHAAAPAAPRAVLLEERLVALLLADARLAPCSALEGLLRTQPVDARPSADDALFMRVKAADRVAAARRAGLARALLPLGLRIYGDRAGWRTLLGDSAALHGDLAYDDEVPALYGSAGLVVDLAHPQMPTAVTQRVFDVPACCGAILADDRPDLREQLEVGKEALAFTEPQQAAELAAWWLRHDLQRARLAEAGRRRVLAEHTWAHRAARLLSLAGEAFGRW
jgi:hypothetical protein